MKRSSEPTRLILAGRLSVDTAEVTRARLEETLAAGDLVIDCSGAESADITLIQLLLATRRSAAASGRKVTLAHPPAGVLAEVLTAAGFTAANGGWIDPFWSGEPLHA